MAKAAGGTGAGLAPKSGVTLLPPGKLAAAVTYLAMSAAPPARPDPQLAEPLALERLAGRDVARYLAIFRRIGMRWLWFSRLAMPRARLVRLLDDPGVQAFAVVAQGRDVGLLELDARRKHATELAFLGLDDAVIGRGAGRWLMNRALELAFSRPIARFFVHTCNFDHPGAIGFYERSGFIAERMAVEIADDPRLKGHLPREAAPHVPITGN